MTSPSGNSMDAITSLLAERQRYESWIATLETRRGSTPAHVYDRVRADYERRLGGVMDQLSGRSGDLEQTVTSLAARVAELMNEETAKRDERAEAELRAAVGEFEPDQWNEISSRSDAEISRLAAQRTEVGNELAQVQELLVQATRKSEALTPPHPAAAIRSESSAVSAPPSPAPAAAPSRPAPVMTTPPDLAAFAAGERPPAAPLNPPPASSSAASGAPPAARPERSKDTMLPDFDELAFLKSVVEPRDARRQVGASDRPVAAAPAPSSPADVAPGAAARPAAAQPSAPPPASAPSGATAQAPRTPPSAAPTIAERAYLTGAELDARSGMAAGGATQSAASASVAPRSAPPSPPASTSPSTAPGDASSRDSASTASVRSEGPRLSNSVPAFLKDVPAEQVKTLKCQECGTMNYPTEWYCERCGGELAAM